MNSLRVLGAAAAVALVLPLAIPSAGFAQQGRVSAGGMAAMGAGGARAGGGGGGFHGGGGGFHGGAAGFHGGGGFRGGGASIAARPSGMPQSAITAMGGGRSVAAAAPSRNWSGGGGHWHGGGWRGHRHGGFWPGVAVGATVGALGSYAYYGNGYYNDPYYYDDGYYDDSTVAVVPDSGGDSVAYCRQRYKSYDVASGTYLGYDGQRHPCP